MRQESYGLPAYKISTGAGELKGKLSLWGWVIASLILAILLWEAIVLVGKYPTYILPTPMEVWQRFLQSLADGTWWTHTRITLLESILGFALGFGVAAVFGYILAHWRAVERLLSPHIAASQALPVVAIAPLITLWFGYGLLGKVIVCALVVFFPILVNTIVGIRNVPRDLIEVAQVYGAGWWQTFWMVELPLSLPVLLGGIRLGLTLSITGAVVGEFVGADRGLGVLLNISKGMFDTPLMFVALITLALMAAAFYGMALLLEKILLAWHYE